MVLAEAFRELLEPHRYKIYYGGRGGAKSWAFADTLLLLGTQKKLRILCARELQVSISDSVHKLLSDQISRYGLESFYTVQNTVIRGANGTEFLFKGLRHNSTEIKSTEGIDVCWVEEAEKVSDASWELLIPTVRKEGSEIWISFNPRRPDDATYKRFILNKPEDAFLKKVSWRDNPFFPAVLDKERRHLEKTDPEAYAHIWEGEFDTRFFGGVYSKQIEAIRAKGQISEQVAYDDKYPVYTAWDLGFDDATAIWFFQVGKGEVFLIDYYENNGEGIGHYLDVLTEGHRKFWQYHKHYVPHDAQNKVMAAGGRSIIEQAWERGVRMDCIPATSMMNSIEALRAVLPRCWFNSVTCKDGIDALLQYCFEYDEDKGTFKNKPLHNWASHGCDAMELVARVLKEGVLTNKDIQIRRHQETWKRLRREHKIEQVDPYATGKPVRKKKR